MKPKTNIKFIFNKRFLLLILVLTIPFISFSQKDTTIIADKGVLDLRNIDFSKDKIVEIKGQFEFFWNKLYTPDDFKDNVITPDCYVQIPGGWSSLKIGNKKLPDTGFATYRLVVFANPEQTPVLTLKISEILTAYNAWFNGQQIAQVGNVGNKANYKPGLFPVVVSVQINQTRNEFILQISNYCYRENSIDTKPYIGSSYGTLKTFLGSLSLDFIIFGIVLIMSFYHFGLFILRRKNIAALLFAVFSLIVAVRIMITGNYPLNFFFHITSWKFTYITAYSTFYTAVPVFVHFFFEIFNDKKHIKIVRYTYLVSFLFLLTLFLNSYIFSELLKFYQLFTLILIVYIFTRLFKYLKEKRRGSIILSLGFLSVLIASVNDILFYNDIIYTTTLLPVGMLLLILSQALSLAQIFTKAFTENERLNIELEYNNQHLEEKVKLRTEEINQQKQEIIQKNEELMQINEEINAQKEEIISQRDLLEEQNEQIKDSINYASVIQTSLLPTNEDLKKYFNSFVIFMPRNTVSGDFYWYSDHNPQYLFFAVGDCTGHGIPGAFLSLIGIYLLNTIVIEQKNSEPSKILENLDLLFFRFLQRSNSKSNDGLTITVLRFDKNNTSKVTSSSAKQSFYLYKNQTKEIIRHEGVHRTIGLKTKASELIFINDEFVITINDTLYIATDGYIDQNNPARERFGTPSFVKLLNEIAELPLQQQKVSFIRQYEEYSGGQPQLDDITLVGIKIKPL